MVNMAVIAIRMRSTPDYVPAIIFLLASELLMFYVCLLWRGLYRAAVQVSAPIILVIIGFLICGVVIRDVRFYAYATATIGIALRAAIILVSSGFSDVLLVSAKGAALILSGQNPYEVPMKVWFLSVTHTHIVFDFPPLEPLFYMPFIGFDLRWVEFGSGSLIVLILLVTCLRSKERSVSVLYLALYCFSTFMVWVVGASTNDTSAALFPFLAIWFIMFSSYKRRYDYAGLLLGLGVAFKQFGIFPLIFVIGFLIKCKGPWLRTTIAASLTTAAISLPFLLWNPTDFLFNIITFFFINGGAAVGYYFVIARLPGFPVFPWSLVIQLSLMAVLSVFLLYRIRNWAECQLAWTGIFLLALVLGRYVDPAYFVYVMPFWILGGMSSLVHKISPPRTAAQRLKGTRGGLRQSFIA